MKALTQNKIIKNSLFEMAKKESSENLNDFSMKCLDGLRKWIIQNKERISEKKFERALMIIAEQVCNSDQTVFNPGFDYDKKWLSGQLKKSGINKLDKND